MDSLLDVLHPLKLEMVSLLLPAADRHHWRCACSLVNTSEPSCLWGALSRERGRLRYGTVRLGNVPGASFIGGDSCFGAHGRIPSSYIGVAL